MIFKNLSIEGFWWLPEDDSTTYKGTLKGNPLTGYILHLQGNIKPYTELVHQLPIIHGKSLKGHKISLVNCLTKGAISNLLINQEKYEVYEIYIGAWMQSADNILIDELEFTSQTIQQWTKEEPFYQAIKEIGEYTLNKRTFKLFMKFNKELSFSFKSNEPIPFKDYFEVLKRIQDFFTFILKTPVYPTKYYLYMNGNKVQFYPKRHEINVQNVLVMDSTVQMVSFRKSQGELDFYIRKWLDSYEEFSSVIIPFTESYTSLDIQGKFRSLIHASENLQALPVKKKGLFGKKKHLTIAKESSQEYTLPFVNPTTYEKYRISDILTIEEKDIKGLKDVINETEHPYSYKGNYEVLFKMKQLQWLIEFILLEKILEFSEDKEHILSFYFVNAYSKESFLP